MWMECISDRAYANREDLAATSCACCAKRSRACSPPGGARPARRAGALGSRLQRPGDAAQLHVRRAVGEKSDSPIELAFARDLVNAVTKVSRSSASRCTCAAATGPPTKPRRSSGDYRPLADTLRGDARRHLAARAVHAARRRDGGPARPAGALSHRRGRRATRSTRTSNRSTRSSPTCSGDRPVRQPSACCSRPIAASPRSRTTRSTPRRLRKPNSPRLRKRRQKLRERHRIH